MLSGSAGNVVQARDVSGGVHFHRAESRARPPRQLPAAIRDFTGRSADLAALDALLPAPAGADLGRPGAVVISAIDGTAGIGKTALAVYWAHRVRDHFPDGTLYVNLRGYGPGRPANPGEVLGGFLRALGIPAGSIPADVQEQAALYRSRLDGRRVLVVLDNAHKPDQVRPLLPGSETCLALVTSRSSLTGLVIGQGARPITLDLLSPADADALLRRIIGDVRADAEPDAMGEIAHACARLPLALRIAGQRAAARPHVRLTDIAAELVDQRHRLDALSDSGDETTTVRALLTWSYRRLPPGQQLVFRRLGVHPGTEISVHAMAALIEATSKQARRALEALADVHMIDAVGKDRYRTHDLLHVYALEQAEQADTAADRDAALRRLLGFYLHTTDAADRASIIRMRNIPDAAPVPRHPLAFTSEKQALDWYQTEYTNLVAAAHHAAETGHHDLAWQIPAAMTALLDHLANRDDWLAICRTGLAASEELRDEQGQVTMLTALAYVLTQLRRFDDVITYSRQAVDIARNTGNAEGEAHSLNHIGNAYRGLRRFDKAVDCCRRSLQIYRELGNSWAAAIALNYLGETYQDGRRFDEAIGCHEEALRVFRQSGDSTREGWTLRLLGDAYQALSQFDTAIAYQTQALTIGRRAGYLLELARLLRSLGDTLHATGDRRTAQHHWREALTILEQIGDPQADDVRGRLRHASSDGL
jgi:tetratricopeptide (TPR) repeat protein